MIADSIKALRENCNLTQVQLAEKLGVTRSSVNAWEMGSSLPTIPYVLKMANIFGVSTDLVLDRNKRSASRPTDSTNMMSERFTAL